MPGQRQAGQLVINLCETGSEVNPAGMSNPQRFSIRNNTQEVKNRN